MRDVKKRSSCRSNSTTLSALMCLSFLIAACDDSDDKPSADNQTSGTSQETVVHQKFDSQIERKIIQPLKVDDISRDSNGYLLDVPFSQDPVSPPVLPYPNQPKLKIRGNAGCGCFFYDLNHELTYFGQIKKIVVGMVGHIPRSGVEMRPSPKGIILRYEVNKDHASDEAFFARFEILKNGEVISFFKHTNIPPSIVGKPEGVGHPSSWKEARSGRTVPPTMLEPAHNSLISSYFPETEFQEFISAAIQTNQIQIK